MQIRATILAILLPLGASAEQPLSVIEWITQRPPDGITYPVLNEPPVSNSIDHSTIDVSSLDAAVVAIGLVPGNVTGLPVDLWLGSDANVLSGLIAKVAVADYPAMQRLLYTLLLSETLPPSAHNDAETLLLARIDRLLELGATDPAQALIELAGATENADRFGRWFDATLLNGDEDKACAAMADAPHLAPDYAARIFCDARRGDWQTAALTLETVHALGVLPPADLSLLDRYLSPGIFEGAPPLPAPDGPDPLTFRLFETIGERLPTASLPRGFATVDLRDVAGWKAQLEAAERLTRIGALGPNRLLGLYSERRPAASGGIWDRVHALQRFETALETGSNDAVAKTLPEVWQAMRDVRLEVPFASLFAERLADLSPDDQSTKSLIWQISLLGPDYETPAQTPPDDTKRSQYLGALALGQPGLTKAPDATAQAISEGFAANPPLSQQRLLDAGQLGEALLRAIILMDSGARGNPGDLTSAMATLRAVGMEDTARRAGLQLMLLERR
ncbi:MAG: hypothetical protein L3J36_01365 [Rhodobacteraceae bacterium]|nr:hypothetical protein [Paracoccaceae bacterium]